MHLGSLLPGLWRYILYYASPIYLYRACIISGLRNQQANLLRAVWMRSRDICLQKYEMPVFDPEGYQKLLDKHSRALTGQHLFVFKALFAWRDQTAREEDESIRYVDNYYPRLYLRQSAFLCCMCIV